MLSPQNVDYISWAKSLTKSQLRDRLKSLTPKQLEMLDQLLISETKGSIWIPQEKQTAALRSKADELFYGGMAGGGKTSLLVGAAVTEHLHSVIYRRHHDDLSGVITYAKETIGHSNGLSMTSPARWQRPDERFPPGWHLHFAAVSQEKDAQKRMGRGYDLIAFDEVAQFSQATFLLLRGWLRSSDSKRRLRVLCAGNPPLDADGAWLFDRYKRWLDPDQADIAEDGDLLWFVRTSDGREVEVDGPEEVTIKGETLIPKSRTFIRSTLEDNEYIRQQYRGTLQELMPGVRAALLHGDFTAWQKDDLWQVIPTSWVAEAQKRWTEDGCPDAKMATIGVDPARGGEDETVLSPRTQNYFHEQIIVPGVETPDGGSVAALVFGAISDEEDPQINIDAIGIGASVVDHCVETHRVSALNSSASSSAKEKTGRYGFVNKRSEWWWRLREALDPDHGEDLVLPPDPQLRADLTTPRFTIQSNGIKVESKPDIFKRIQRSPDRGDALVYSFAESGLEGVNSEHFAVVGELTQPDWR